MYIYKIVSKHSDKIYIGKTNKPLKTRLIEHKSAYKAYIKNKPKYYSSFDILKYGDCSIELIKESNEDLEKQIINEFKDLCINTRNKRG